MSYPTELTSSARNGTIGPFSPGVPLPVNGASLFVAGSGLTGYSQDGALLATVLRRDAFTFAGLFTAAANFVANLDYYEEICY